MTIQNTGNPPPLAGYIESPPGSGHWIPDPSITPGGGGGSTSGGSTGGGGSEGGIGVIIVSPPPVPTAGFSYTLYANGLVGFINKSLGSISAYFWDFGDGGHASSPNVLHQFVNPGTYSVTLTVKNSSGQSSKTQNVTIASTQVIGGHTIDMTKTTVDFFSTVGALAVQFTDLSTKEGARSWDFGDGKTSVETNPYHAYASNGIYEVTLTINGVSKTHQVVVDRGARLDWQDNSSDETGFKIEHSLNGTDWTQIATTAANIHTLLVTQNIHGVDPTALNYFRVRAYNVNGNSGYTNIATSQCL